MESIEYLKTMCPACDGMIEFPAHALGQQAECPHCHKAIFLGSVASLAQTGKAPTTSNQSPPAMNLMNVNQKILTGVALLVFFISVCVAPWEVTTISTSYQDHSILGKTIVYSPVWEQPNGHVLPDYYGGEHRYECRLLLSPLLGIWIAIGVVFTGLFFLLKNTPSILKIIKPLVAQSGPIAQGEYISFLAGVFCMLIAVVSIGAGFYLVFIDRSSLESIATGFLCWFLTVGCVWITIVLCNISKRKR